MPFQVTDPELETKLSRHAKAQPVPSSKSRLAVAIINATLSAADAEGETPDRSSVGCSTRRPLMAPVLPRSRPDANIMEATPTTPRQEVHMNGQIAESGVLRVLTPPSAAATLPPSQ